jgi:hypothetical protein
VVAVLAVQDNGVHIAHHTLVLETNGGAKNVARRVKVRERIHAELDPRHQQRPIAVQLNTDIAAHDDGAAPNQDAVGSVQHEVPNRWGDVDRRRERRDLLVTLRGRAAPTRGAAHQQRQHSRDPSSHVAASFRTARPSFLPRSSATQSNRLREIDRQSRKGNARRESAEDSFSALPPWQS